MRRRGFCPAPHCRRLRPAATRGGGRRQCAGRVPRHRAAGGFVRGPRPDRPATARGGGIECSGVISMSLQPPKVALQRVASQEDTMFHESCRSSGWRRGAASCPSQQKSRSGLAVLVLAVSMAWPFLDDLSRASSLRAETDAK
jgi:hypothetical protein